ncbi:MAG: hypothetical protein HQK53_14845 [Oligoflexia bacterium]|nr:hypothetical protein [Oligoflexia bacterium]
MSLVNLWYGGQSASLVCWVALFLFRNASFLVIPICVVSKVTELTASKSKTQISIFETIFLQSTDIGGDWDFPFQQRMKSSLAKKYAQGLTREEYT